MVIKIIGIGIGAIVAISEVRHSRVARRVTQLGWNARAWESLCLRFVAVGRSIAFIGSIWAVTNLVSLPAVPSPSQQNDSLELREHIIILVDVSPSMLLMDGGIDKSQVRLTAATDYLDKLLVSSCVEDQLYSLWTCYDELIDYVDATPDKNVVRNFLLNDRFFTTHMRSTIDGPSAARETNLVKCIRSAFEKVKERPRGSVTFVLLTDGDCEGLGERIPTPKSVDAFHVLGVGSLEGCRIGARYSKLNRTGLQEFANANRDSGFEYSDLRDESPVLRCKLQWNTESEAPAGLAQDELLMLYAVGLVLCSGTVASSTICLELLSYLGTRFTEE